jgi:hypothetical protein
MAKGTTASRPWIGVRDRYFGLAAAVGLYGIGERQVFCSEDAIEHLQSSVDRFHGLPNATERVSIMAELALTLVDVRRLDDAMQLVRELEPLDSNQPGLRSQRLRQSKLRLQPKWTVR